MLHLFAWSGASRRGSTDLQDRGSETRVPPLRNRVWVQLSLALVGNLVVIIWLGTVHAASPFNVNSTSDEPDSNLGDGICLTASNKCTLRAAIQEANQVGIKAHPGTPTGPSSCSMPGPMSQPQQTINLPSGTYQLAGAEDEDDAATGDLDIKANLQINGADEKSTIIDANHKDRAFDICKGWTVQIIRVTIKNGQITKGGEGGGIQNRGQLTLDSVRLAITKAAATQRTRCISRPVEFIMTKARPSHS
jgi:CSLREA domain-containing protein